MTRYKVADRVAVIPSGIIALTPAQAKPRLHNLKVLGSGRYEILRPVEFKAGEAFGYAGDLPKAIAEVVEELAPSRASNPEAGPSRRQEATPATE